MTDYLYSQNAFMLMKPRSAQIKICMTCLFLSEKVKTVGMHLRVPVWMMCHVLYPAGS